MGFGFRNNLVRNINSKFGGDTGCYGSPFIEDSLIYGSSEVMDKSIVHKSVLDGFAKLVGHCVIQNSYVGQVALVGGNASVIGSFITDSAKVVDDGIVASSWVGGKSVVSGNGFVRNVDMDGYSHVCGTAEVVGGMERIRLTGSMFLHKGLWRKAPLILYAEKSNYSVQECADNNIHINCICNTPQKLLGGAGRRYLRMLGASMEEIDEIELLTKQMRDMMESK